MRRSRYASLPLELYAPRQWSTDSRGFRNYRRLLKLISGIFLSKVCSKVITWNKKMEVAETMRSSGNGSKPKRWIVGRWLKKSKTAELRKADGVFFWSFYRDRKAVGSPSRRNSASSFHVTGVDTKGRFLWPGANKRRSWF
jgi:hypothetical protein